MAVGGTKGAAGRICRMTGDVDVVVVGAGAAGVSAARRIAGAGRTVLLVEAGQRIGGRAHSETLAGMPLDLGCGWLHSADRNPLVGLAEGLGLTIDRSPSAWERQYRDLGFPPADRQAAGAAFDAWHQRLEDDPPASDRAADALEPGHRWNGYIEALSGYINGTGVGDLSAADYLAYDRAASETNWRVREGYGTAIAALLPPVPVRLGTPVTAIDLRGRRATVETRDGTIAAGAVILTVSTAMLASGGIAVTPAIDDHRHAASRLPLGLADKLFLQLDGDHGLEAETHLLGRPAGPCTGSYYIMPFGRPVIEGFFGGSCAEALEDAGLDGAFAFAADELAALLGSAIRPRLRLLAGSRWRRTDHIGGSYSHALPGGAPCRATLARPAGDRLFFAGEATHATDFSTAHGAWESGARAADEAARRSPRTPRSSSLGTAGGSPPSILPA